MTKAFIQAGLSVLAGLALWWMWRSVERHSREAEDPLIRYVVFLGLTVRTVAGTLLFWISWLGLPFFSRLQMGNGHWFFATDGRRYLREAINIAQGGLPTIIMHHRTGASVSYVQTLATGTMLFGDSAAVGVLVNLFSYMGMCLILLKWRESAQVARVPGMLAIAAISVSPSAILWSTQPLKDTFFQFLIVCLVAAGALWQRGWRKRPAVGMITSAALLFVAALFLASGIRWYFGFIALCAAAAFLLLTAFRSFHPWKAAMAGLVLFFLLSQSLVISASAYLPLYLQRILVPWKPSTATMETMSPGRLAQDLKNARTGFEQSGGATSIGVGGALADLDSGRRIVPADAPVTDDDFARLAAKEGTPAEPVHSVGSPQQRARSAENAVPPTADRNGQADAIPAVPQLSPATASPEHAVAASHPTPVTASLPPSVAPALAVDWDPLVEGSAQSSTETQSMAPVTGTGQPRMSDLSPSRDLPPIAKEHEASAAHASDSANPRSGPTAEAADRGTEVPAAAAGAGPAPVSRNGQLSPSGGAKRAPVRRSPSAVTPDAPPIAELSPETHPAATVPRVPAAVTAEPSEESQSSGMVDGEIIMPTSTVGRLLAGAAAVLLPSRVARDLGLLEMGGGRGFWWFTDIDSVVFDVMLVVAVVFIFRRLRWRALANPIFWFVVIVAMVAVPIAYTITNYGTLFRLRAMLFVTLALIPLALSMESGKSGEETEPSEAPSADPERE